jgi:hypothetical protein
MSSVTRFIRQIPQSTTYYSAAGIIASPATLVYEFVPSSSNYVGNYPNPYPDVTGGYVQTASLALQAAIAQANTFASGNLVLRDMGKTIFAPTTNSSTASWAYFRQVQLIDPNVINSGASGFIGGTSGTTFGVLGDQNTPDAYTDFLTFYIPVTVAGIGLGLVTSAFALAGGQM